ncbi:hypothetical protein NQZ68_023713 [Dissostichus eleginoides]|nr:hypothetical protein NQZ68_023713 [Dissostichus eleginoides]
MDYDVLPKASLLPEEHNGTASAEPCTADGHNGLKNTGLHVAGTESAVFSSGKYASSCPSSMVYSDSITTSSHTCRCLGSTDLSCHASFPPIDGCVCAQGTYLDDTGKCVPSTACPCYDEGSVVPPGQVVNKQGVMWYFFNCSAHGPAAKGTECEKSCNTLDMACVSTGCVSGCMCPSGMVSDGKGGCIKPDACSCVHNGISYQPGESTKVDCNTCTCKDRKWQCTTEACDGTCSVYGAGHYMTFDQKRFTFDGSCEYILTQDYCGSAQSNGTFRVISENLPCGTTGTTCSKTIRIFLGNAEVILTEGRYQLLSSGDEHSVPFRYSTMGIYLVVEANNGLILMWDRKTSLFIQLSSKYKGRVCGLCGNYDGNANNDFTTRGNAVVVNPLVFGNSWKDLPSCPDGQSISSPCTTNPYRQAWSQKQCSLIQSDVFSACHSTVDPTPYYDACVFDSCACDTGGDLTALQRPSNAFTMPKCMPNKAYSFYDTFDLNHKAPNNTYNQTCYRNTFTNYTLNAFHYSSNFNTFDYNHHYTFHHN